MSPKKTVKIIILSGRSGVGKTVVANKIHEQLSRTSILHVAIEGDSLDAKFPEEQTAEVFLANLYSIWYNYTRLRGCSTLLINGTALVLEHENIKQTIQRASMTLENPDVIVESRVVVLSSSDQTAYARMKAREVGLTLQRHVESSLRMSKELDGLED